MNLSFRLPGQNEKPIRVVTKYPDTWYNSIKSTDITADKITREVELAEDPIRIEGNLFFVVQPPIALLTARIAWAHVVEPGHILEVHYPNRVTQKKPHEDKVVVNIIDAGERSRIAINVDNLLWTFLRADVIDPQILEHLANEGMGKEIIAECCRLIVMRNEPTSDENRK